MKSFKIARISVLMAAASMTAIFSHAADLAAAAPAQLPAAQSTAEAAIPSGTAFAVMLESPLNSAKNTPGQVIVARVMQDIPLEPGTRIRAGSKLIGRITKVADAANGRGGQISFRFDELSIPNSTTHIRMPANLYLQAMASGLDVEEAGLPAYGPDEGTPETSWTTTQVGGDVVYRGDGPVTRGSAVVGKPVRLTDGVIEYDRRHQPQAVWVFSLDASGAYGFSRTTIAHAGKTNPAGEITLSAKRGTLKVRRGAAMLLRVGTEKHPMRGI